MIVGVKLPSVTWKANKELFMPLQGTQLLLKFSALNERQAMKNHGYTLEQLADRGGISLSEAAAIIENRRWRFLTPLESLSIILAVA